MAEDRVSSHGLQIIPVVPFREDTVAECTRLKSSFCTFRYVEYDLTRFHQLILLQNAALANIGSDF